jgi:hypothetical protein
MLRLGCRVPGQDTHFLHSPLFDLDERILGLGSRILLDAAIRLSEQFRKPKGSQEWGEGI